MLQDRLTARFLTARKAKPAAAKPAAQPARRKAVTPSAMDTYSRGRHLRTTVWL